VGLGNVSDAGGEKWPSAIFANARLRAVLADVRSPNAAGSGVKIRTSIQTPRDARVVAKVGRRRECVYCRRAGKRSRTRAFDL